jgi:hypothetical protein
MSCTNCNNSSPCGCKDTALTTPCGYTQCGIGNERCDDVQCTECVSYCGTSFQVTTPEGVLKIDSGERLDQIIQKFALMIANGLGACNADNVHHAPYNLYAEGSTNTTISIIWNGISSLSEGVHIYYDTVISPSGWVQANTTLLDPAVLDFTIITLSPNTEYKIKLTSLYGIMDNACDSVEILVTTLT